MHQPTSPLIRDPVRLAALRQTALLDSEAEEAFDRLTRLATRVLAAPAALVSLVDADRQYFKSACGLPEPWASRRETPLEYSFCQHAVANGEAFVVEDARVHPLVRELPSVSELNLIAYAGVPLVTAEGQRLGSFCVIDNEPRRWTAAELDTLAELASVAVDEIELRLGARARTEELILLIEAERQAREQAEAAVARLEDVLAGITDGFVAVDRTGTCTYANRNAARMVGRKPEDLIGRNMWDEFPDARPGPVYDAWRRAIAEHVPQRVESFAVKMERWFEVRIHPFEETVSAFFQDITERKRIEQTLRASEERYQLIARATNDVMWDWDVASGALFWNDALRTTFGYDAEELEPSLEWWEEQIHPDDRARVTAAVRATLEGLEEGINVVYRFRRADQSWASVLDRGYVTRDDRGAPLRMVGAITDLTERERADAALRSSERHLRRVLDSLAAYVGVLTPDGTLTLANQAAVWGVGKKMEDVIGRPFVETPWWAYPEERAKLEVAIARARAGETSRFDFRVPMKDGQDMVMDFILSPMLDDSGAVTHLIPSAIDITDRVRTTDALRKSEERYRSFFEDDISGDYVAGRDGRILQCNRAFLRMFGFDSMDAALQSHMESLHMSREQRDAIVRAVRERGRVELKELEMRRPDGAPVHVMKNVIGLFDETGELEGTRGYLVDVTDRKVLEAQLRQSQKLEAVGQLAGGVAHDFNNMLTAISGHTQLLLEEVPAGDPMREDLLEIRRAADRSAALTRQLLAFSRKQILQPQLVNLSDIVTGMEGMLRRLIGEHISIVTRLSASDEVHVDPGQMEQVILNLVVNARDAMPLGGTLVIETAAVALDERYERLHGVKILSGRYAMLAVSDTGCGMDPEVLSHVFEPFFTTKAVGKGTGLGLSTVYGIVKQSGGYVFAYSELGYGSTFKVYLPLGEQSGDADGDAEVPGTEAAAGSGTVLVVEDEPAVRSLVTRLLRRAGYTVLEAESGAEAFRITEAHAGRIDVLVSDVIMPGLSGKAVAERLTQMRPEIRVLFMSGYTDDVMVHHGVLDPGTALLQKPFAPDDLLRRVRQVARGEAGG